MEVTFWGVRGSIASPGPSTVRYGGNTSCVSVKLASGELVILDCGTGARTLGLALMSGPFGQGKGRATMLLSHGHWDHIQGFPFFTPFYVAGNTFTVYGGDGSAPSLLEEVLEGQMAAQYFPVQSIRNMGAAIALRGLPPGDAVSVAGATVTALAMPHGRSAALAFRIEEAGHAIAYLSDAGYGPEGPSEAAVTFCRGADLLIHDSSFTPDDKARHPGRGLASLDDAVACAVRAGVQRLALFHYDQDYSDGEVDALLARAQGLVAERGAAVDVIAAAEGLTIAVRR